MTESVFRAAIFVPFAALYLLRLAYKKQLPKRAMRAEDVTMARVARVWALTVVGCLLGLEDAGFVQGLPVWLRWAGEIGLVVCFPLSWWTHRTLGAQFSVQMRLWENHVLVRMGPYRYVRHPMYATLLACVASVTLASANLFVAAASTGLAVAIVLRLRREEEMLCEHFGAYYREYRETAGALLPKIHALLL